jgi:hypothetical protein
MSPFPIERLLPSTFPDGDAARSDDCTERRATGGNLRPVGLTLGSGWSTHRPAGKMVAMESAPHAGDWATPPEGATDPAPPVAEPPTADLEDPSGAALVEQALRVTTGLVALGIAAGADAVRRTMPRPAATDEPSAERVDPVGLAAGAALGLTLLVGERAARVAGRVARSVGPPASWFAGVPPLGPLAGWTRTTATSLDDRWRDARPNAEAAASAFARELVPQVVDGVLDQLDLTWLVAERVDLDELVARVDLDRIVARVDLDELAGHIDVDAIVSRVDLGAIVDRVDVDRVAERIDLDAVIARLDLAELARTVIEEIDLPEIIRMSSGSIASETVRGARIQGIEADAAVSRAVDRILLRRRARDTDAPGTAESLETPTDDDPDPRT